jgi:NADH-quinone oxidoreductase subunit F
MAEEKYLLRYQGKTDYRDIDKAVENGAYSALRKALAEIPPETLVQMVKDSGLRGRGGAGFPCGAKWGFLPKDGKKPIYLICNADESEPGTYKDRDIIRYDPHLLVEGIAVSAYAIKCRQAFLYIRGEFYQESLVLEQAIEQAYAKGYLGKNILGSGFDLELVLHRGAGAYICGEETGLIESLEGKRGQPRLKPPFPAVYGLYGCPTIVNNVETLSCVPWIVNKGVDWFKSIGPEKGTGPKVFCVSGHVVKPGLFELPMSVTLRQLIYDHAGGIRQGRALKAVIPGGSSVPVLKADEIDVQMDFDSLAKAGTMLGSAAVMVMDETTCMVRALANLTRFYAHESCGQCTQCREGSGWVDQILWRIVRGEGTEKDLDLLLDLTDNMKGKTICVFPDAIAAPVESFVKKFRDEFVAYVKNKRSSVHGGFSWQAEPVSAAT